MKEIAKCPFCGGEAKVDTSKEDFEYLKNKYGYLLIHIKCCTDECDVRMPSRFGASDYETAVDKAIDKWNQRAYTIGVDLSNKGVIDNGGQHFAE